MIQGNAIAETSTTAPLKLLVTVVEAAEALGLGRTAMYELLLAGELPSVKIGRARRIPVQALETFVARRLENASHL